MASFASASAAAAALPPCAAGTRRGSRCVARASAVAVAPAGTARTHYEVLGVGAGASRGEIKAAYRRLAREVHPDAAGCGDESFIQLHAAYATLADPDERARYDRAVARPAAFRRAPSAFQPRRWETDQCW
ncbi:chaperone protein dnaJ 11, chloroplastic-like [Phragmites australis]|uniref:chaperone protein dnaJ 11, chloroplastic-like n=1 Tax=Phragmites australis TaxID=29695 RepID=UPI002D789A55|nr:chaperone protein dnaJ 11, chloroplastic-like [Phragmites australis]